MSMNYLELLNPESLSESTLLEILKNKCIDLPNMKTLKKSDLVEMFKRVALPMPQRQFNKTRHLGNKLNDLRLSRNIAIDTKEEQVLYESAIAKNQCSDKNSERKSSKRPPEDTTQLPKKIRLSNSSPERNGLRENGLKKKFNDQEDSAQTGVKKRRKITLP